MFQLQEESLKRDHARSSVTDQWNEMAKAIADFKTRAMTEMNSARQAKNLEIAHERNRIRAARADHRPYSTEVLQKLTSELGAITSAESKLQRAQVESYSTAEAGNAKMTASPQSRQRQPNAPAYVAMTIIRRPPVLASSVGDDHWKGAVQ